MAEEKDLIGFMTSGKALEQAFEKERGELSKAKSDWEAMNKSAIADFALWGEKIKNRKLSGTDVLLFFMLQSNVRITKLGIELTEAQSKLAKTQKDVESLRLRLK